MTNFLLEAAATPANTWWIYIVLIGLVLVMLIVPSITNRKRVKEYNEMINGVRVGDTVRTVGGVIGRIVKINDKDGYKTIIVETGAKNAKTTMEFDMASVGTVLKSSSKPAEKTQEPKKDETTEEKQDTTENLDTEKEKAKKEESSATAEKSSTKKAPAKKASGSKTKATKSNK